MFSAVIRNTPMNSEAAENFFSRPDNMFISMYDSGYTPDYSFLASVRALLANRLRGNPLTFFSLSCNSSIPRCTGDKSEAPRYAINGDVGTNRLTLVNFNSTEENNRAWLDALEEFFTKSYPEFTPIPAVTKFFEKQFRVLCYVCVEKKSTIVFSSFIGKNQYKYFHYLQCAIPSFFPWYFNKDEGLSDVEYELMRSLLEDKPTHYLAVLQKISEDLGIREWYTRETLHNFSEKQERRRRERAQRDVDSARRSLEEAQERESACRALLLEKEIYLAGCDARIASNTDDGLADYVIDNRAIEILSVQNDRMRVMFNTYLSYWDPDDVEVLINNRNSYLYYSNGTRYDDFISAEDIALLMKAVFIDMELKIRVCSHVEFNMRNYEVHHEWYDYQIIKDRTPNPHHFHFDCFGNYRRAIENYLCAGDYELAFEQTLAAVMSINPGESTTFAKFMKTLYTGDLNNRCIELPDGSVVDPKGAIEYLKKQKEATANG